MKYEERMTEMLHLRLSTEMLEAADLAGRHHLANEVRALREEGYEAAALRLELAMVEGRVSLADRVRACLQFSIDMANVEKDRRVAAVDETSLR